MLFFWLLLLGYIIGISPMRFHIAYANRGIDDHFLLEMVFFHIFRWKKEVSVIRPRLERWGFIARMEEEKDFPAINRVEDKKSQWTIWIMLQSANRFRKRLVQYGLGVSLLSLFLPKRYLSYIHVVEEMENRGRFTRFEWQTKVGSTDAAWTAWETGAIWGIKGEITGFLQNQYRFQCIPALKVIPSFGEAVLDTSIDCIFELKVGHIITAGFREWLKLLITGRRE